MATIAIVDEWRNVDEALDRLEVYRVLHPAVAAMRKLVDMIRHDPAFSEVHPVVSHVSLLLSRGQAARRVSVGWHEGDVYALSFVDPSFEFSEERFVSEKDVLPALHEYVGRLDVS